MRSYIMIAALLLVLFGCGGEPTKPKGISYLPATSPANVIENIETSYRRRDPAGYAVLLAEDFRFYLDQETLRESPELPPFFSRLEDSTFTAGLFLSARITDVQIELPHGDPEPVIEPGREMWVKVDVPDTFLQMYQLPDPGDQEGITFLIDGQLHRFYFRHGKNPADTLETSPTSGTYFLVEWLDLGGGCREADGIRQACASTTWSRMKLRLPGG